MAEKQTPQQRALAAAEELSAEGAAVTARAVRDRAQVAMNVASPVAKEWNARESHTRGVPEMPESVLPRVDALWRAAVEAARGEHQVERDGWLSQVKEAEDERDAALDDVTAVQTQLEEALSKVAELEALVDQERTAASLVQEKVTDAEARASSAEQRATTAEGVAEGLREALAAVSTKSKR
ncbi:DNA-binding protein [Tessaracoccus sp. SD287]|uniref:DNA-binding protein n=1 Tax=Tessaracoccus sp. SD287 TaxID=2782008 RepID=UPI001A960F05|nr:DNA-binding protein [Tessaracoccus sp. SD287]MBO1032025.1 DNA-binding protein [Tessaracoccus sp. SD287]